MEIQGTRGVQSDNTKLYLLFLRAFVKHADPDATIKVHQYSDHISVVVDPNTIEFREHVLKNLLSMHKMFGITTEFAKSTNITKKLFYSFSW